MKAEPTWNILWIDNDEDLAALHEKLQAETVISLDTETVGWESGNERLCLVQIGLPSRKEVAIVDPTATINLHLIEPALSAKTPQIVAHNASFEERQLGRHGIKLRGIVDTLSLARRLRPDLPNHTLQTCCRLMLDLEISKEEQTSDWSRRPLSDSQRKYAALDAEVAMLLYWNLAEMEAKLQVDPELGVPDLMAELNSVVRHRLDITKEIAFELAFSNAREEMLREAIRTKLIHGEPPYEGKHGRCQVSRVKRTEIDPELVRTEMPTIADLVVAEYVDRQRLLAVMKEHGISEDALEKVLKVVGYNDRLSLSLKDL